jgi:hypothetical protein
MTPRIIGGDSHNNLTVQSFPLHRRCTLHTIPKLPDLLLIIVRCKRTRRTERNWHRRPSSRLYDSGNGRSEKRDTVSEREFSAIVLVFFDTVA